MTVPFPTDSGLTDAAQECLPAQRDGPAGLLFDPRGSPGFGGYGFVDVENGLAAMVLGCPGDAPPECGATVTVLVKGQVIGENQVTVPRNGVRMWHYVTLKRDFLARHRVRNRIKGSVAISFQDPSGRAVKRRSAVTLRLNRR